MGIVNLKVRTTLVALFLCAASLPISGQEPQSLPAAEAPAESLQVILDKAREELEAYFKAFTAEMDAAEGLTGRARTEYRARLMKLEEAHTASVTTHAIKALALVKELPDSEIRREGLEWLLSNSSLPSVAFRTIDLLAEQCIGDERLGTVCLRLRDAPARETLISTLEGIVQRSTNLQVRGKASWALALQYKRFAESAVSAPSTGSESRSEVGRTPWDGKFRAQIQLVAEQYSDLTVGNTTLGSMAEALLRKYEQSPTGTLAPEIEGEDLDGVEFKLSDYRGKVVLLTFWGNW